MDTINFIKQWERIFDKFPLLPILRQIWEEKNQFLPKKQYIFFKPA